MPGDSLQIGASGLDAYQAQIDVISNNIANVGTTAYKGQNVTFQDLFYQTQSAASGPTSTNGGLDAQQIGIGVKIGATDTDSTQGGIETTGVNTNLMINGDGYFLLRNSDGTGEPRYTRDGDFSLNSNGLLYDPSSGLGVMGYTADASGNIVDSGSPGPIQIPIGLKSQATATGAGVKAGPTGDKVFDISYGGNLDSTQYSAAVSNGGVSATNLATVGTTVYDSLGDPHLLDVTFEPALSGGGAYATMPFRVTNSSGVAVTAATEWAYTVNSTDGTLFSTGTSVSTTQYAFFDASGNFINTSGSIAPASGSDLLGPASVHAANGEPSAASGDQLTIKQWGAVPNADNSTTNTVTPGPIGLDFSALTSNAAPAQVTNLYQDGVAPGILDNISVGQDGTITGSFTNGQNVTLARVAVVAFQNEAGLTRIGSSMYEQSANSGQPQIGTANSGRFGAIQGDALELSNVSIADEFTKLITAQNAFAANSKSITTANENLQTVIELIH